MGVIEQKEKATDGIFAAVEVHKRMTQQLIEKFHDIYNSYPDDWRAGIMKHIPTGLEVEAYVGMFHMQILHCSWADLTERQLIYVSVVNARIGFILHLMPPTAKNRFCSLINQLGKFNDGNPPVAEPTNDTDNIKREE
jgi:hypothetical protein